MERKKGRLEIVHDQLSGQWYAYQPVEVEPLISQLGMRKHTLTWELGFLLWYMWKVRQEYLATAEILYYRTGGTGQT